LNRAAAEAALLRHLRFAFGSDAAMAYRSFLGSLDLCRLTAQDAALLIIDPQRAFTQGAWMRSIGPRADVDVVPIRLAFDACSRLMGLLYGSARVMFTRCPFPPDSYGWDDSLAGMLDQTQIYFLKPGNSVFFPPLNGFRHWIARCRDEGIHTLVMGGCTLTSCVRVSAIESRRHLRRATMDVIVDVSLCGARTRNYAPLPAYGGVSAVASAVRQMSAAGVRVVRQVEWC
jgi:hypothetical protein